MKIFYFECTEAELKANRGIMDNVVDTLYEVSKNIFGNISFSEPEQEESEAEDNE